MGLYALSLVALVVLLVVGGTDGLTVAVAGATGYIGRAVCLASARLGHETIAICRQEQESSCWPAGVEVVTADVSDPDSLERSLGLRNIDAIVACLASRQGTKTDAYKIDYRAAKNCVDFLYHSSLRRRSVGHFILLSAFCVQKPKLHFQRAKLRLEREVKELAKESRGSLRYSIIRPTAFFKSLSMQLGGLQSGMPFMVFDGGASCRCNPIAEADLADFMLSALTTSSLYDKTVVVGGAAAPKTGFSKRDQGMLMMRAMGMDEVAASKNIVSAPLSLFEGLISLCASSAVCLRKIYLFELARKVMDVAEILRIGKYYAVEDMLSGEQDMRIGTVSLMDHFSEIVHEGQETDRYVAVPLWIRSSMVLASRLMGAAEVDEEVQRY
jgi:divinyl chlorophyllide a 8-vinyl-reductase